MAIGALSVIARGEGARAQATSRVTGFDDICGPARAARLTTVHQPMRDLGEQAVRLLLDRVNDPVRPARLGRVADPRSSVVAWQLRLPQAHAASRSSQGGFVISPIDQKTVTEQSARADWERRIYRRLTDTADADPALALPAPTGPSVRAAVGHVRLDWDPVPRCGRLPHRAHRARRRAATPAARRQRRARGAPSAVRRHRLRRRHRVHVPRRRSRRRGLSRPGPGPAPCARIERDADAGSRRRLRSTRPRWSAGSTGCGGWSARSG